MHKMSILSRCLFWEAHFFGKIGASPEASFGRVIVLIPYMTRVVDPVFGI
ncbi:hypothetical protein NIES39_K02210 [Arthrospira platensis NIES-39]|nr:hypothetical protein NIES39_K02210 [Arthrospira platensis NIES-39]